jgi:Tol biopolymer transport system component
VNTNALKGLWIIRLKDAFAIPITEEPSATFSAYQWDPWGTKLVYQRFELTSAGQNSSIWLWDWETRQSQLVIEEAGQPHWLP